MPNRKPRLELTATSASPVEAAAIVAALERFMRDRAPQTVLAPTGPEPWLRAAMLEGLGQDPRELFDPWINA